MRRCASSVEFCLDLVRICFCGIQCLILYSLIYEMMPENSNLVYLKQKCKRGGYKNHTDSLEVSKIHQIWHSCRYRLKNAF